MPPDNLSSSFENLSSSLGQEVPSAIRTGIESSGDEVAEAMRQLAQGDLPPGVGLLGLIQESSEQLERNISQSVTDNISFFAEEMQRNAQSTFKWVKRAAATSMETAGLAAEGLMRAVERRLFRMGDRVGPPRPGDILSDRDQEPLSVRVLSPEKDTDPLGFGKPSVSSTTESLGAGPVAMAETISSKFGGGGIEITDTMIKQLAYFEEIPEKMAEEILYAMKEDNVLEQELEKFQSIIDGMKTQIEIEEGLTDESLSSFFAVFEKKIGAITTSNKFDELSNKLTEITDQAFIFSETAENIMDPDALEELGFFAGVYNELVRDTFQVQEELLNKEIERADANERFAEILAESNDLITNNAERLGLTNEEMEEMLSISKGVIDNQKDIVSSVEKQFKAWERVKSRQKELMQPLEDLRGKFEGMKETVMSTFGAIRQSPAKIGAALGLVAGLALAKGIYGMLTQIEGTMVSIAQETGFSGEQLEQFRGTLARVGDDLIARGLEIEDIAQAVSGIVEEFGSIEVTKALFDVESIDEVVRQVGIVQTSLSLSSAEAIKINSTFRELAELSGENREQAMAFTAQLAKAGDVAPQAVFQDITSNAEQLAKFGGDSVTEYAKLAVEARRLNLELSDILGLQERFLTDMPSTMQQFAISGMMAGVDIDTAALTQAAYQGGEQFLNVFRDQISQIDFESLDTFAMMELADATGIAITELQRMAEVAELTSNATASELEDAFARGQLSLEEAFPEAATAVTELQNKLRSLKATFLMQFAEPLNNLVIPVVEKLVSTFEGMIKVNEEGQKVFDKNNETVQKLQAGLAGLETIARATYKILKAFGEIALWIADESTPKMIGKIALVIGSFTALKIAVSGLMSKMGKAVWAKFAGWLGKIGGAAGGAADGLGGFGNKLGGLMKSVNPKQLLSFGATMIFVAGALWVFSKAVQNLVGVDWSSIGKGIAGLAALSAPLLIFAAAGTTAAPALLAFGAASLMLSGAMWIFSKAAMGYAKALDAMIPFMSTFMNLSMEFVNVVADAFVKTISAVTASLIGLANVAPKLYVAAGGVAALGTAMAAFAGGAFFSAITNFFGGSSAIKNIIKLGEAGRGLEIAAEALKKIATAIRDVSNAGRNAREVLDRLSEIDISITNIESATVPVETEASVSMDEIMATANIVPNIGETAAGTFEIGPEPTTIEPSREGIETEPITSEPTSAENVERAANRRERQEDLQKYTEQTELLQELVNLNSELIKSLKRGEIAVNLDGRKVSKELARSNRNPNMR